MVDVVAYLVGDKGVKSDLPMLSQFRSNEVEAELDLSECAPDLASMMSLVSIRGTRFVDFGLACLYGADVVR